MIKEILEENIMPVVDDKLLDFEKLCLEIIASQNKEWKIEFDKLISKIKVIDRVYGNPFGIYVDFAKGNWIANMKLPNILSADLELTERNDAIVFMFYPNTDDKTPFIFLEVSICIGPLDIDYISRKISLELGR